MQCSSLPGTCGSPSPRTLRRFWADFTLPHIPIKEEHPLPKIPLPLPPTVNHLRGDRLTAVADTCTVGGSRIPLASVAGRQTTCCAELQPHNGEDRLPKVSPLPAVQSTRAIQSHDMKPVGISGGTPPQSPRHVRSSDAKTQTPPHSPRLVRSPVSSSLASSTTPPQSPRLCRSRISTRPPRSPLSPDLRSPQSSKSPNPPLSPKPPVCPSSPRSARTPVSVRTGRSGCADQTSPQSPKLRRSPASGRPARSSSQSPDSHLPRSGQPPNKPPRCLPPIKTSSSPSRSAPHSPCSSGPPSPCPEGGSSSSNMQGKLAPKKPPRTLPSLRSRSKSPQSPHSSQTSSPTPSSHSEGGGVRESVRACCRARPGLAKGGALESAAAGKAVLLDRNRMLPCWLLSVFQGQVHCQLPSCSGSGRVVSL